MTDALFDMKDAPKNGDTIRIWRKGGWQNIYWSRNALDGRGAWRVEGDGSVILYSWKLSGYLPLPTDSSGAISANVAKTAGEWLSVCEPGHRMTVLKFQMDRMTEDELAEVEQYVQTRRALSALLDHVADELAQEPTDG